MLHPTLRRRRQGGVNPKPKMRSIRTKGVRMVNGVLNVVERSGGCPDFSPAAPDCSSSHREVVIDASSVLVLMQRMSRRR